MKCLKEGLKQLPGLTFVADYLIGEARYRLDFQRLRRELGLRSFTASELLGLRRSDTLFVLGTGPSINTISTKLWREIAEQDSVALNYWVLHDFVPSFYIYECSVSTVEEKRLLGPIFASLIAARPEYDDLPKFVTEVYPNRAYSLSCLPEETRRTTTALWAPHLRTGSPQNCRITLRALYMLGGFRPGRWHGSFKGSGTVTLVVQLALFMGYRQIILCGFDPLTGGYFYEKSIAVQQEKALQDIVAKQYPHKTAQYDDQSTSAIQFLEIFRDEVLARQGVQLQVLRDTDELGSRFAAYHC